MLVLFCHSVNASSAGLLLIKFTTLKTPVPPASKSSSIKWAVSVLPEAAISITSSSPQIIGVPGVNVNSVTGFKVAITGILFNDSHDPSVAVTQYVVVDEIIGENEADVAIGVPPISLAYQLKSVAEAFPVTERVAEPGPQVLPSVIVAIWAAQLSTTVKR